MRAVVADKGHHSGENLAGLEERELVGLVSSPNTARGEPGFQRQDFTYDPEQDLFVCPAGILLRRRQIPEGAARQYQARGRDCRQCPHFGVCTKSKTGRSVSVPVHEELISANRERVRRPSSGRCCRSGGSGARRRLATLSSTGACDGWRAAGRSTRPRRH